MVYATWSTGFRPGGVNRNAARHRPPYKPDYLTNYEVGWKTSLARRHAALQRRGLFWRTGRISSSRSSAPTRSPSSPMPARRASRASRADVDWRATDDLTISGSAAYTDAHLTQPYCKDPTDCAATDSLQAPNGQQLPITPKFKAQRDRRATISTPSAGRHVQGHGHVQRQLAGPICAPSSATCSARIRPTRSSNFSFGVTARTTGRSDISLQNAFDERAQLYRYSECTPGVCGAEPYIITNRPRTIAFKVGQKF